MKSFHGKELKIGDKCLWNHGKTAEFIIIEKITKLYIKANGNYIKPNHLIRCNPEDIIKNKKKKIQN